MRIGTLTLVFPSNDNYGAYLQGYALCKAIDQIEGFSGVCLPYYGLVPYSERSNRNYWQEACNRYDPSRFKNTLFRSLKCCNYVIRQYLKQRKIKPLELPNRKIRFEEFGKMFQMQGISFYNASELADADVDGFIVGSDWVWHVDGNIGRRGYYGQFDTEKPIFSYAASFGIQPTESDAIKRIIEFLPNFQNLSCREQEGTKLIKSLGYSKAHWDVDPTLLIEPKVWEQVLEEPKESDYIAIYGLPNNTEQISLYVERIRKKFPNSKLVILNPNSLNINDAIEKSDIGPQDFLGYIKNARYVITNSFHGCVFCCLFKTPFTVFTRFKGDSRIQNLLELTELKERSISYNENCDPVDLPIDWTNVEERITTRANISREYLKSTLKSYEASIVNK